MEVFNPNSIPQQVAPQTQSASAKRKLAELLRAEASKSAAPATQRIGGLDVNPHWTQTLLHGLRQAGDVWYGHKAGQAEDELAKAKADAEATEQQRMQEHANQWRSSIPQAIAAQAGTAPPDELGGGPPTEGTPAQPITSQRVLEHALAASGNPLLKDAASLYHKTALGELDREDAQAARAAEKAAQIEAQKARDAADKRWREQQAEEGRQLRLTLAGMKGGGGGGSGGGAGGAGGASFGGPATIIGVDPETNQQIFRHTKTGQPFTYGADGQPVPYAAGMANKPTTAGTKDMEATAALEAKIARAESELANNPDAVGVKTMLPNFVSQFTNPEGVPGRLAVSELSAEKAHELYGAAFTDAERIRANAFLPAPGDTQATTKAKIAGMRTLINEAKARQARNRGIPGGAAPKPEGDWGAPAGGAPKVLKWGELK